MDQENDALDFWTTYLADVGPCRFPRFDGEIDSPKRPLSIEVELRHRKELQTLAAKDKETLPCMLRTAWALVLRCYTGLEDVCFGYQEIGTDGVVDGAWKLAERSEGMSTARMTFDGAVALAKLLDGAKDDYVRGRRYQYFKPAEASLGSTLSKPQLFNSAMLLQKNLGSETSYESALSPWSSNMLQFAEVSSWSHLEITLWLLYLITDRLHSATFICTSRI